MLPLLSLLLACDGGTPADTEPDADGCDAPALFYGDADGDGFGVDAYTTEACAAPDGYAAASGDCDDGDPAIHPDAEESCNGADDDCDLDVDEGLEESPWYLDGDGDGEGDPDVAVVGCAPPEGYAATPYDCDDQDDEVYVDAPELCDGKDNDCDFVVDDDVAGTGAECAARDCAAILEVTPGADDGTFFVDPDGDGEPLELHCDMSDGGWMLLDGALIAAQGWTTFDVFPESAPSSFLVYEAGWEEDSSIGATLRLSPWGLETTSYCKAIAVRATVTLPFSFESWRGSWRARGETVTASPDDDRTGDTWGDTYDLASTTGDCPGRLLFGTDAVLDKEAGAWGADWYTESGVESWVVTEGDTGATDTIRWEVLDHGRGKTGEGVLISDVAIYVR